MLCFHFLLAFKTGSGTGGWMRTLSLSLPAFNRVARRKENVLKNKIFSRKRCCDLIMTESVLDKRTTKAIGWNSTESEKFKLLVETNRTYTLLCLEGPSKNYRTHLTRKKTYEFQPKVRSFSKIAKTCHQDWVTIVAVSTWNRKRHLSLHQN